MSKYKKYIDSDEWEFVPFSKAANGISIKEMGGQGIPNVEIEGKEHVLLPNGLSQQVSGPSHADGGIPLNLAPGSMVFSEKLKDPDTKKSYAKMAKKYETKDNVEMLDVPFIDPIQAETAQMMIQKKNEKLQELFQKQEMDKLQGEHGKSVQKEALQENGMMKFGGKIKKMGSGGGNIYGPTNTSLNNPLVLSPDNVDAYGNPLTTFGDVNWKPSPSSIFLSQVREPYNPQSSAPYEGLTSEQMKQRYQNARENTGEYFPNTIIPPTIDKSSIKGLQYAQGLNSPGAIVDAYKHGYLGFNNEHKRILQEEYKIKNPKSQDYERLSENDIVKGHQDNLAGEDLVKYSTLKFTDPEKYKHYIEKEGVNVGQGLWRDKDYTRDPNEPPVYYKLDTSGIPNTVKSEPAKKSSDISKNTQPIKSTATQNPDFSSLAIPLYVPNTYTRDPLNYHNVQPQYINPRYLDVSPELNQIVRGQRAFQTNLGSRTSADVSNLLQSQTNAYNQQQQVYGQKYNYDRQQDLQSQEFNARAKQGSDQYNQQAEFSQLEDPRRRREGALDTQKRVDVQGAIQNEAKQRAYDLTRDYIQKIFNPFSQYDNTTLVAKYGGKVKLKAKVKKK